MAKVNKVLVIGSGPIIIGQAAEFAYAGDDASKGSKGSLESKQKEGEHATTK